MTTIANENAASNNSGYFNLHTEGIAYLNDIRLVVDGKRTGRKFEPFLACRIAALRGAIDAVEYTYFDVRVSGGDAQEIIKLLEADVKANKSVIIGFRIGDIYLETFTYQRDTKNHKKGDVGVSLKGRLLKVTFAKVDGKLVDLSAYNQKQAQEGESLPADGTNG